MSGQRAGTALAFTLLPVFMDALKDEDEDVRRQAAAAIQKIDPETATKAALR
jgi:HEAT repeat protein